MRSRRLVLMLGLACAFSSEVFAQSSLSLDEAIALAKKQNPEIVIARKQVEAARGGIMEARSGYLPSLISGGLLGKQEYQSDTDLRTDDYSASVRLTEKIYAGGATTAAVRMARLTQEKRLLELSAVTARVVMDLRIAYYELLLNRAKIGVQEQAVQVMRDELKAQEERFTAGTVGELNVRRAEVSLANQQPDLYDAQTRLQNSYLRVNELCGLQTSAKSRSAAFETSGRLQYHARHPDLTECLARASALRPELKSRQLDVAIAGQQLIIDRSETRPRVEVFSGYELYSERDPQIGPEFNHGYIVGVNAGWHIFDGHATQGRMVATRARRDAAEQALKMMELSVASEVRSAFLDLQQADRTLESETQNVDNATQSLEIARGNLAAGLGTQLDVLQATADVTRVRTTRLSAIYLHNVALARLARACVRDPDDMGFAAKPTTDADAKRQAQALKVVQPPSGLGTQR